jgi:hypothetical protein
MFNISFFQKIEFPRAFAVSTDETGSILPNPFEWRRSFSQLVDFRNLRENAEIRSWLEPLARDGFYIYPATARV